jgi:glyoxylase-like metal-dependent hydrolase (beta-lactamase superfamily II)
MLKNTALLLFAACTALAQPAPAPLSAEPLGGGVYWVKGGSGANAGIIVGAKEAIVIDAKMTGESAKAMLAAVAGITKDPVRTLILTHSDGDHVNGLAGFPQGLNIIAHANTRRDMEAAFKDPKLSALTPYLPNRVIDADQPVKIEGVRVNLLHFGPAHTSGDLVVFLPDRRVAFLGDLAFIGRDPLIHRQKGGTSFGLVRNLKKILALDADTFIAGHNEPLKKADIGALLASIEDRQAKIQALVREGKSLDEVGKSLGVATAPGQRFPSLIEIIYREVSEKK